MSQSDPMKYEVVGIHDAGGVNRAFLRLACAKKPCCEIPLIEGPPKNPAVWGWDGKADLPTVTPSIHCSECGFHKTLTKGVWT